MTDAATDPRPVRLPGRAIPPLVLAAALAMSVVVLDLRLGARGWDFVTDYSLVNLVMLLVAVPFGIAVLARFPGHVVGRVLVAGPLSTGVHVVVGKVAVVVTPPGAAMGDLPFPLVLAWWQDTWLWVPGLAALLTLTTLYFPDGRLPSRRWWPAVVLSVTATVLLTLAFAGGYWPWDPEAIVPQTDEAWGSLFGLTQVGFPLLLVSVAVGLVSLFLRNRRAIGIERQQIRAALLGFGIAGVGCMVPFALTMLDGQFNEPGPVGVLFVNVACSGIFVALGLSMLRYRLYDIDLVISRAVIYGTLALFIAGVYIGAVVIAGRMIGVAGQADPILSVLATTVVAVSFQPARRRLERFANRLVFGRRVTHYDVLSGVSRRVGRAAASPSALDDLAELVAGGTGGDPARVWLRVGNTLTAAAQFPAGELDVPSVPLTEIDQLPDAHHHEVVRHDGEVLGVLAIAKPRGDRVSEQDVDLIRRLAGATGVLLRNLRLDAELAQQLVELQASRTRLVDAQDEARRQIERALRDGTRQDLLELRHELEDVAGELSGDTPKTTGLLAQLRAAADAAVGTLDALASGVYPPELEAHGLAVALSQRAVVAPVPITIHAPGLGRHSRAVEAAVYFSVLEAVQNTTKYARASGVHIRLWTEEGALGFEVTDDGVGFDPSSVHGSGLPGMVDRLDTVGGVLRVESSPGAGTAVIGRVPVDARAMASIE